MKIRVDFEHYTFANDPLREATVPFLCQCCVCVLTVLLNCDIHSRILGIIWGNNRHCLENLGIEFWGVGKAYSVLLPNPRKLGWVGLIVD